MWCINEFSVCNLGPFQGEHKWQLKRGAIGLFGDNGKGKSTFANLLYAGLTGDFGRFDGVKVDCINSTADAKAPAYLCIKALCGTESVLLKRNFRPNKSELRVGKEEVLNDAARIQERLSELGIDRRLMDFCVFKAQNQIYDFLETTPTERAKAYQILNRTEDCEDAYELIGDLLNHDKELTTQIEDNSDELTATIGQLSMRQIGLNADRVETEALLMTDKHRQAAQSVVDKDRQHKQATTCVAEARQTNDANSIALANANKTVIARQAAVSRAEKQAADFGLDIEQVRFDLKQWDQHNAGRERRSALQQEAKELAQMMCDLVELVEPVPPARADELEELSLKLRELVGSHERGLETLRVFEDEGVVACPTCGTPTENLEEYLLHVRETVLDAPAKIKKFSMQVQAIKDWKEQVRIYEKSKAALESKQAVNAAALKSLAVTGVPNVNRGALEKTLTTYEEAMAASVASQKLLRQAEAEVTRITASAEQSERHLADRIEELKSVTVSADLLKKAKIRLAEHQEALIKLAELTGTTVAVNEQLAAVESQLERLRAKLKRDKRLQKMVKVLQRARDVLHKTVLPQQVAQANLVRMEGDINKGLELFGSPFWIEADDNLSFQIHKPGEPSQRAERLSIGQKVVLAIAFWSAVNSLFKSEIGIMCLDEPTANLDESNRRFLAEALAHLTKQVRGKRQLIMITHADELRASFDQVISL